jgi:hypothetical protein
MTFSPLVVGVAVGLALAVGDTVTDGIAVVVGVMVEVAVGVPVDATVGLTVVEGLGVTNGEEVALGITWAVIDWMNGNPVGIEGEGVMVAPGTQAAIKEIIAIKVTAVMTISGLLK